MPRLPFALRIRAVVLLALATAAPAFAELRWEAREIAVRIRATEGGAQGTYHFVNAGTTPLTILAVRPGCGCTVPALAKNTFAPGERGEISLSYHPGNREGRHSVDIDVSVDDGSHHLLTFTAEIEVLAAFDTRYVFWRGGEPRQPKRLQLTLAEGALATLAEVRSSNPDFGVAWHPVGATGREFAIDVTPPAEALGYTVITVATVVGAAKERREFNLVARTL